MSHISVETNSSADPRGRCLDHRPFVAEIRLLDADLSRRVSRTAASKLVAIYRLFIQNGFAWSGLLPLMDCDTKHRQELMLGSVMAALFYTERQITMATDQMMGRCVGPDTISMEQCEKLFNFAKDLAFDFKTQILWTKRDDQVPGSPLDVH